MTNQPPVYPPNAYQPQQPPPPPAPQKHTARKVLIILAAIFCIGVAGITSCVALVANNISDSTGDPAVTNTYDPGINTPNTQPSTKSTPAAPKSSATKPSLTVAQQNALRSAASYLDMSNFSRKGLITQLKYEGFSTKDATYAVDHVKVNWNTEAAGAAATYLEMSSFSHSSLTQQLLYEGFTKTQAAYGVKSVGL